MYRKQRVHAKEKRKEPKSAQHSVQRRQASGNARQQQPRNAKKDADSHGDKTLGHAGDMSALPNLACLQAVFIHLSSCLVCTSLLDFPRLAFALPLDRVPVSESQNVASCPPPLVAAVRAMRFKLAKGPDAIFSR